MKLLDISFKDRKYTAVKIFEVCYRTKIKATLNKKESLLYYRELRTCFSCGQHRIYVSSNKCDE